ncbi:MAG: hypothetical protein GXP48_04510 [Acidobacteria bacterium]|nr:hypothetical protein [Acidobacteriota bacterium]
MQRGRTWWRAGLVSVVLVPLLLSLGGCENTTPTPKERQEVTAAVMKYLHQLSDTYANMDARRLKGAAGPGEMAAVAKLLHRLAESGDRLEATLLKADIQKISVFRVVNATVQVLEVWDVKRLDAYTGKLKGENPATVQHSVMQLRKINGAWLVTSRTVLETERGSPWKLKTPKPAATPRQTPSVAGHGSK